MRLCVLCHQPQHTLSETGESFDLKVMIHRIHRGENLPSVKAGKPFVLTGTNDYSTVAFPQDIRNCYYCHEGTDPAKKPVQAANWYSYPSSKACGSCHDDVNFTTGAGHPAGPQADGTCADLPPPAGRRRVGRLGHRRAHGARQVEAAQGPEGRDHLRRPGGAGQEAGRHVQAHERRRHDPGSEDVRLEPEHRPRRADVRLHPLPRFPREGRRRHLQRDGRNLHLHERRFRPTPPAPGPSPSSAGGS